MASINGREFLSASATAVVAVSAGGFGAEAADQAKQWYSSMIRCGYLNLNERDALNLGVETWMDYFASLRVDTVLHSGGGSWPFIPRRFLTSIAAGFWARAICSESW